MIVDRGRGRRVMVRYRDAERKRHEETISHLYPYCFVEDESAEWIDAIAKEKGFRGMYGESLTKVVMSDPSEIGAIAKEGPTWEANIPFVNRVLADRLGPDGMPFENYDHRIWYLDCEWNPTTNRLRMIVVYDNYTDTEYVWFVHKDYDEGRRHSLGNLTFPVPALSFNTEREMLEHFINHMKRQDPDVITGWYVVGADIKTIIERCKANDLSPNHLSPHRRIRYEFGDWDQPIPGRNCIDLMLAFSKLWELKNGKLPAYGLADVSQEVLKESKVELPDGHDTYHTDLPLYVDYCLQDVRLLPKLDAKVNAIEYYLALQHLVQCDIRSTPHITKMFTCLVLQDPEKSAAIPTRPQFEKESYQGADVMEPVPGIYDNVGILDVRAMYHSNAKKYGICWTTLDDEGQDCGNGTRFNTEKPGLLVRQMDKMTRLRDGYKRLRKNDPKNYDKWDTMQYACKSLVASMYGVAGDAKYGLYHPAVAGAITHTSRQTLNQLKDIAEDRGFKVIYGHTDSVFCSIGSPGAGKDLTRSMNAQMKPIEIDFEKWCSRMILIAKNRYAGLVTWSDGENIEPTPYYKGIELKQSRMPQVMKTVMTDVIGAMMKGEDERSVTSRVTSLIEEVVSGEVESQELCMKGKLERNLSDYKVLSEGRAGAAWANEYLGKGYRKGSFFLVTITDEGKYVAFDDPNEIEGLVTIGYQTLAERFIVKKITPYYSLAGWSLRPIENALNGVGDVAWL